MAPCSGESICSTTMRGFLFTDSVLVDYNVFSVEKKFIHCNKLRITIIGILI